jgi:hypothetical protein
MKSPLALNRIRVFKGQERCHGPHPPPIARSRDARPMMNVPGHPNGYPDVREEQALPPQEMLDDIEENRLRLTSSITSRVSRMSGIWPSSRNPSRPSHAFLSWRMGKKRVRSGRP